MRSPDALLAALAFLLALACAPAPPEAEPEPPPRPRFLVSLSEVTTVGPYLGATLANERFSLRFFFPQSEACLALIRSGAEVRYIRMGSLGTVVDEERRRCEPAGVASLREWRDQQPRRRDQYFTPRVHVAFRTIFEGEQMVLLRGRFPLAMEIRWPAAMDSVVMLPADPRCDEVRQHGEATMEYHDSGPDPFLLVEQGERCPILGFAVPLDED
jgi:hypothetical protein